MKKQLELGMPVHCLDGEAGDLDGIVVDPRNHQPAYLVVRQGLLSPRQIVVPVTLVADVASGIVLLETVLDTLKRFPDYEVTVERYQPDTPTEYRPELPPLALERALRPERTINVAERTVPERTVDVARGMTVYDDAGSKIGRVEGVIVDTESRQVSHLVVLGPFSLVDEHRLIPVELVDFTVESRVYLRVPESELESLPVYWLDHRPSLDSLVRSN